MSYSIIYERQFIKIEIDGNNGYIPLVLVGSNNCIEPSRYGRSRRARDWTTICVNHSDFYERYKIPVVLEDELDGYIEKYIDDSDDGYYFKYNNNFVRNDGFRRFWKNGIKQAKTIDEINSMRIYPLEIRCMAYKATSKGDSVLFSSGSKTSKYLEKDIKEAFSQVNLESDGRLTEKFHICFTIEEENILKRTKLKHEIRKPKRK